jgi:hypothetical protein
MLGARSIRRSNSSTVTMKLASSTLILNLNKDGFFEFEERMTCEKTTCGTSGFDRCMSIDFVHFKEEKKKECKR